MPKEIPCRVVVKETDLVWYLQLLERVGAKDVVTKSMQMGSRSCDIHFDCGGIDQDKLREGACGRAASIYELGMEPHEFFRHYKNTPK